MILKIGSKYLFDTSVFIDAFRKDKDAQSIMFQARFNGTSVGYSIVTETELWVGVMQSRFLTPNRQRVMLRPFKRYFINVTIARRAGELVVYCGRRV
ncbi:MAG: hypothetical protein Q9P01_02980 [Anaerolineae bacterium]|nr:hypothetical protein [Anaerolineae bacterium]